MKKTIHQLFGVNSAVEIDVQESKPKYGVTPNPNYVYREDLVRDMLVFWRLGLRSCMLTGHKGSGKTSIVEQFHDKVQVNLQTMTGNGKTTLEALFGQYVLDQNGKLIWQDGPVANAARHGHSILINEFNAIPEDVQISLNDVAHEGSPISLPETGEQFMPAEGFRLYCTINPKGSNDFMYRGRKEMDAALKERFFWIRVPYGTTAEEKAILMGVWEKYTRTKDASHEFIVDQMLQVAACCRRPKTDPLEGIVPIQN